MDVARIRATSRTFSDSVSGCNCAVSMRPASESVTVGVSNGLAEQVSRKRPADR